jgi:GDP/UDP-N,N'-diacetylbacillosamine 2-epimerase (hydrolysing)
MIKRTVLVITGTRADYGLLRPVMREIEESKKLKLEVIATGMHTLRKHGYTVGEIRKDKFPVVAVVTVGERDSMTTALAKEIEGIASYCENKRPDLILVLGDRDECFAGAIVGGHLGIPVAHIHGGDKTGWVVDEYIRHATTKFSHLHFAATKASGDRIKLLGEESWRVSVVGAPGLDELRSLKLRSSTELAEIYGLDPAKPWYVFLHHPASLDKTPLKQQIAPALRAATDLDGEKIILLPNSDSGSEIFAKEIERYRSRSDVHIFNHVPRSDLVGILKYSKLLIGNSSMGIIDASFLKLPTVSIGARQAGRERGSNVVDSGYAESEVVRAIRKARSPAFRARVRKSKSPYGDGRTAVRIVQLIERHIARKDLFAKRLTYV